MPSLLGWDVSGSAKRSGRLARAVFAATLEPDHPPQRGKGPRPAMNPRGEDRSHRPTPIHHVLNRQRRKAGARC
jgi:hypothetical protein